MSEYYEVIRPTISRPLTLAKLSEVTGLPVKTLRRFAANGMRHQRVGRTIFALLDDYEQFIAMVSTTDYEPYSPEPHESCEGIA